MSHQPFETWIFDQAALTTEDLRTLQAHLDSCQQCRKLHQRWQPVHQELRARRTAVPAPGFTQRWKIGLVERRARQQRRQAWKIAGLLMAAALFFLLLITAYTMATTSPSDWLVAAVRMASSTSSTINLGIHFVQDWLTSTPLAVNFALWIYLTVCICILTVIWIVVLWRTNIVGVFNR